MKKAIIQSFVLVLSVTFMLALSGCASNLPNAPSQTGDNKTLAQGGPAGMKTFGSWNEVSDFLRAANPSSGYSYGGGMGRNLMLPSMAMGEMKTAFDSSAPEPQSSSASSYSQTNVQVAGVDEADIVKNDGKYIYVVGNEYGYYGVGPFSFSDNRGKITIIDAYPASGMAKAGEVSFEGRASEMFVYKEKLVVFGSKYKQMSYPRVESAAICLHCIIPPYYSQDFAFMKVYDISNKASPALVKEIEVKGSYVSSRMIEGKVYGVFSDSASYVDPMPLYAVDGIAQKVAPADIAYFDYPDSNYNYNEFLSIDLDDLSRQETHRIVLMGYAQNLFVSQENMYVSFTKYDYYYPEWEVFSEVYGSYLPKEAVDRISAIDASNYSAWRQDRMKMAEISPYAQEIAERIGSGQREKLQNDYSKKLSALQEKRAREAEKTEIHKLSLSGFEAVGKGEVPGHVLNQFSMDEYDGHFRIATTIQQVWGMGSQTMPSSSGIYVLDKEMKTVGKVEGIAPGESIYSARFMGNRAYLVTFKKIDPFFTVDLTVPEEPRLLGKLKIPGYSDYLHPYDENYIIGVGKGAIASEEGDFSWYQGVKLSLFDVRDLENPREVAKFEIGDRGTDSYALSDHKAFLFDRQKNLLVIPITLAKLDRSKYANGTVPDWAYGDYVFQGAYVFKISPEEGFALRGTITHASQEELLKSGEYYWSSANVMRSLYMDDYLYTISDRYVKANDLPSLAAISSVQIGDMTDRSGQTYIK